MENIQLVLAYVASIIIVIRFWPYVYTDQFKNVKLSVNDLPKVSIIIPARNEALNLPGLLKSLRHLTYSNFEIIVVDDNSEDETYNIARTYPVKVIKAPPKPCGWIGKSWACYLGAKAAEGSYLLFTDADTIHKPYSLKNAVVCMLKENVQLLSSPMYHINKHFWQKILGPFYCLIHTGSSPYDKPTIQNVYAFGTYLLFDKQFYNHIGGHSAVRDNMAEDAALAKLILQFKGKFKMYKGKCLYEVQMYQTLSGFVNGWSRILRLGMEHITLSVIALSFIPFLIFNVSLLMHRDIIFWIPVMITLSCFALAQRRMGNFHVVSVLLFPLPVILFVVLGCWAALSHIFKMPLSWRGRVYTEGEYANQGMDNVITES